MNRNLAAKYLDTLLISGQVEMQLVGAAKVYFLSKSVPVLAMLEFSSDLVIMIDQDRKILHINEPAHHLFTENDENIIGRKISEIVGPVLPRLSFDRDTGETPGEEYHHGRNLQDTWRNPALPYKETAHCLRGRYPGPHLHDGRCHGPENAS